MGRTGQLVEGRSLMEAVNHEQQMKDHLDKVSSDISNYAGFDIEHNGFYRHIVWTVTKYKAFMHGISEGFYDNPHHFEN